MGDRLLHAQHNEEICHFLCQKQENADWVATTAFYAALHFIEHRIFPISDKDDNGHKFKIKTFDEYYSLYCNKKSNTNKHSERLTLLTEKEPSIAPHYKWLKDTCWTARYVNYKFLNAKGIIDEVKRRLALIKICCEAPK